MVHFLGSLVRVDTVVDHSKTQVTVQMPAGELPASLGIGSPVTLEPRPVPALAV